MNKNYRRPDALKKFRNIPIVGQLLYIQDIDGEILPVIILELEKDQRVKNYNIVKVLSGQNITRFYINELRTV